MSCSRSGGGPALSILALVLAAGCETLHEGPASDFSRRFSVPPHVRLDRYASQEWRPCQDPKLSLAVAISGGGHRSCNFAAGVLRGLEAITTPHGNALLEIDYLSTTSGGGFFGGAYIAELFDHLNEHGGSHDSFSLRALLEERGEGALRERLRTSLASSLVGGLFSPTNWFTAVDRGDDMEIDVDDHILGRRWRADGRSLCLGDVFVDADDPERLPLVPYWVSNGALYETGAIFPFTPDILECYAVVGYTHDGETERLRDPFQLPCSVAVKASASLPAVVPLSTFKSDYDKERNPYLHITDGGLADNLAVLTALSLLTQDGSALRDDRSEPRRVLIVVDAYNGPIDPFSASEEAPWEGRIAWRTFSLSMHSWRGRYREIISHLARTYGIDVIYISFDEITDPDVAARARAVSTDLSVSVEEQECLFTAADHLLGRMLPRIRQTLVAPYYRAAQEGEPLRGKK